MWFKKKEKPVQELVIPEVPHEHTFKDMPWYMEEHYNTGKHWASYEIIEPYICITCGERINKTLEHIEWSGIKDSEREEFYKEVREKYHAFLKPRAVVEDMINDIVMVKDAHHLEMMEKLRGSPHRGVGTSSKTIDSNFQLKINS